MLVLLFFFIIVLLRENMLMTRHFEGYYTKIPLRLWTEFILLPILEILCFYDCITTDFKNIFSAKYAISALGDVFSFLFLLTHWCKCLWEPIQWLHSLYLRLWQSLTLSFFAYYPTQGTHYPALIFPLTYTSTKC